MEPESSIVLVRPTRLGARLSQCVETFMIRAIAVLAILAVALPARADDSAKVLAPTGTLRAAYIAANPVQAFVDPATKEVRGPGAEITRELAKRAGVPFTITGAKGVDGVLEAVKNGTADIGFLAFDPVRAAQVDFSQDYSLAQNTYVVVESSPIKSVADADRAGVRIGVSARDAGDYFLTKALKHAELKRNEGGISDTIVKALLAGELDAYAGNRMRLHEAAQKTPGLRLVPDNFYGVEQAVIVPKGDTAKLSIIERFIDEARASGFIADAIKRSGLIGVDVAPAGMRK
jgi:polar amino acid transport system substrate-binding protein